MKILILGGSGRLGGAFQRVLDTDDVLAPSRAELDPSNPEALSAYLETFRPDAIVNCIAYNAVDLAEGSGREEAFQINGNLPGVIASAAAATRIPFVQISTDYVFSGDSDEGYSESDEAVPVSVYGESKLQGERMTLASNPDAYIVRTSRLYGPPATSANAKKSFVELILDDASKSARVLVNPLERSAPTSVDDLARHLVEHLLKAKPEPGIYHIINEGGATWFEWAQEIGLAMNLPVEFAKRDPSTIQRPAQRPMNSTLRNTKLPPMRSWKEALHDMISTAGLTFSPSWKDVGIPGVAIERMPRIGNEDGAVLHMLPGGILNAHGFGTDLKDVYAFTAKGKNQFRGGHFHPKLNELFFQFSGNALWVLSDFRESSPTFGKTVAVDINVEEWIQQGSFPRIRVPAGIYHAIFPLTDERVMSVGVGSTPYDKEDYRYPSPQEVPGMIEILAAYGIVLPE